MDNIMTAREYVEAWERNACQHYTDGDYDWLCEYIESYHTIFEIGCGTGYSTLALSNHNHAVIAIDILPEALKISNQRLLHHGHSVMMVTEFIDICGADVSLWKADVVHNRDTIITVLNQLPMDLILLCNPGGNLDKHIRVQEVNLLLQYGFTKEEIDNLCLQGAFHLLHKFAIIYAAVDIAIKCQKPLLIVERGTKKEVEDTLKQIAYDSQMNILYIRFHLIEREPDDGVKLGNVNGEIEGDLFWGVGMYSAR